MVLLFLFSYILCIILEEVGKANKLKWSGHLEKMSEGRMVKMVAWKEPAEKKRGGKPKRKWREAIIENLTGKNIRLERKGEGQKKMERRNKVMSKAYIYF